MTKLQNHLLKLLPSTFCGQFNAFHKGFGAYYNTCMSILRSKHDKYSLTYRTFSLQERLTDAKDRITELVRENTNRLDQLNMLFGEKKVYQVQLDSRQKNLVSWKFNANILLKIILTITRLFGVHISLVEKFHRPNWQYLIHENI